MSAALLSPVDEAGIVAAVSSAYAAREPLLVQGSGTKATMLRPVQAARSLSTQGLSGISLYAPKELVLSAGAGTPMADIERTLASSGQHMIAEPPDYSNLLGTKGAQTFGGVVGANLSGPRRVMSGAMRDQVIGVRAVNGTGETIRSGGRVLKNVTGLDLCKLLTGSYGTLAVLTSITVKVLPAPEQTGSIVLRGLDARAGVSSLSAALGSPYGVSAAAYLPEELAGRLGGIGSAAIARIEDFANSVAYRVGELRALLSTFGQAEILPQAESRGIWAAIRDAAVLPVEPTDAIWRVSVRPSRGPDILAAVQAAGARAYLDWGGGLAMIAGPAVQATHDAICRAAARAGGVWMLLRAPEPLRAAVHVVPPEPAPLAAITRRVKAAFDPAGILNPGRLYAGL